MLHPKLLKAMEAQKVETKNPLEMLNKRKCCNIITSVTISNIFLIYISWSLDLMRQLDEKNAACYFKQLLEAAPSKTAPVLPLTSHLTRWPKHAGHCWRSNDKIISSVGWPAKIYIHQLCVNIGCREHAKSDGW